MSLVEKVKAQIQTIIDEEIKTLEGIEGHVAERVQETSERIKNLIQSYVDLEKTLGNMPNLGLLSLTSDIAKVVDWDAEKIGYSVDAFGVSVTIGHWQPFQQHPAGDKFKLDPKKKYKLLVAFIPIEEST